MNRRYFLLPLVCGMGACADQPLTTGPTISGPNFEIADGASDYKAGFYWLPPMVTQPSVNGTFDAALSPTVEICELVDNTCGPAIATYTTTTGPNGEYGRVQVENEQYHVNWHTNEFELSTTKIYRISVYAGVHGTLLGYADVQSVGNGSGLKNVDTDEYLGLKDGRTLPIKFRIETEIVGNVRVEPVEAEAAPGATQQFMAILSDLHGNPMTADVTWASSDENVATVDQGGLATAVADGVTSITATSERVTGSATLTVAGGIVAVSTGENHSCALDTGGKAYCWGLGLSGQLGSGVVTLRSTPFPVSGNLTFTAIDVGGSFSCAITPTGQGYCWGMNFWGQLGDNSFTNRSAPVLVSGGLSFASINAGAIHTCALTPAGQPYCWGGNSIGQLGIGSKIDRRTPVAVSGDLSFNSISAGSWHTCALTAAGQAYCWGENSGQLGNGSLGGERLTPTPVSGAHTFASISTGIAHTCALTTTGLAYCWGSNDEGQLGNGGSLFVRRLSPFPVSGGHSFSSVSTSIRHTCALTTAGKAYCWGMNSFGQLGDGSITRRTSPVAVSGDLTFASISAGLAHTCGVTTGGETYCWGSTARGRLGNGESADFGVCTTPVPVAEFP